MPLSQRQLDDTFGHFDFHDDPKRRGAIVQSAEWILHNIARIQPPFPIVDGNGKPYKLIAIHAKLADQLDAVLVELRTAGLTHLIDTWDGCWCARHKTWDPGRGLSSHCWAIAVDVNARLFPYGSTRKQDARLIGAFARHGFEWGGAWHTPDPMHFEWVGNPSDSQLLASNDAPAGRSAGDAGRILRESSDDERLAMSQISTWLTSIGVPPQLLTYAQKLISDWRKKAADLLPTAAEAADSIRRQTIFKQAYRALPAAAQAGVDQILPVICEALLIKVRKALGI